MALIKDKKSKGFTLMEILIAVALLAIIAAIAIPNFSGYIRQGKTIKAITDANQLASALNIYNTIIGTPIDESGLTPALRAELIDKNILPRLTADFSKVLNNVVYDEATRFFDAKAQESISLDGY